MKTKAMVVVSITNDSFSKGNDYQCGFCGMTVKVKLFLCMPRGNWIHSRCTGLKRESPKWQINFACRRCEGYIGEAVD